MHLLPANRVSSSPWMNPAHWATIPAASMAPAGEDAAWRRTHDEIVLTEGRERAPIAERARAVVLAYRVYPADCLIAALPATRVEPGATIVQGFRLGPIGLITAVRVVNVFDRDRHAIRQTGFSLVTLVGHPIRGAQTVTVVEDRSDATVRLEIDVMSRPGRWWSWLAAPIVRDLQQRFTRRALDNVRRQATGSSMPDEIQG